MKIIQLSDPHLARPGQRVGGRDPEAGLARAIADINLRHADADLVVISGDLSDDGSPESYATLERLLAALLPPVRLTLGNHDDRPAFLARFPGLACDSGHVQSMTALGETRVILLDTLEEGEVGGRLCEKRLEWLEARLAEAAASDVALFLHHPPMPIGLPAPDACRLEPGSAEALARLCARHGRVRHLSAGHVHRPSAGQWQGLSVSTVRSTCQQTALLFENRFATADEAPGYGILLLEPEAVTMHFHQLPHPGS